MTNHQPTPAACARVRERLDLLLDGGLAPLEAARDGGHLEACAGCSAELARRRAFLAALCAGLAPEAGLQAELDGRLLQRLAGVPAPRATPWRRQLTASLRRSAPAAALAAAALVILALLPVLLGDGARPPSYGEVSLGGLVGNDLPRLEWSSDPLGPWISR